MSGGGTDPLKSMKQMRAIVFQERLQKQRHRRKHIQWYWFTGVPKYYKIRPRPPKHVNSTKMHAESGSENSSYAEQKEEDEEDDSLLDSKTIIAGFSNFTSSHGVTHVFFSKGVIKRLGWAIITSLSIICLFSHLIYLTLSYASYEVTTNIDMIEERSLTFPAVTICNNNAMKNSVVPMKMAMIINRRKDMMMNGSDTKVSNLDTLTLISEERAVMADDVVREIGYSLEEFVIYCSFNGENCNSSDFWSFYNSDYGNCYTFNSGKPSGVNLRNCALAGPKHGLTLILNIGVYEYIPSETDEAGARIVIHPHHSMPFPDLSGISAAPGHTNDIAVQKSHVSRLGKMYGNCTTLEMNSQNAYAQPYDVGYSEWACLRTCYQKHVVEMCGCFDLNIPYNHESQVFTNLKPALIPCRMEAELDYACMNMAMAEFNKRKLKCSYCYPQCEQTMFDTSLSTATFPADSYMDDFRMRLNVSHPQLIQKLHDVYPDFSTNPEKPIASNFLKLNIFYQSLMYTTYSQVPAYGVAQFISDIGGTFGLWIGWSVMTLFEFLGLFSDLFVYLYYKKSRKTKNTRTTR